MDSARPVRNRNAFQTAHAVPTSSHYHREKSPACFADRKSTRLNSSHSQISYAVFCLKKKKKFNQVIIPSTSTMLTDQSINFFEYISSLKISCRNHYFSTAIQLPYNHLSISIILYLVN